MGPEAPKIDYDAKMAAFESIPLFMRDLPTDPSGDNNTLDALQSLMYDGTPDGTIQPPTPESAPSPAQLMPRSLSQKLP